jgi:hypothetical protein
VNFNRIRHPKLTEFKELYSREVNISIQLACLANQISVGH